MGALRLICSVVGLVWGALQFVLVVLQSAQGALWFVLGALWFAQVVVQFAWGATTISMGWRPIWMGCHSSCIGCLEVAIELHSVHVWVREWCTLQRIAYWVQFGVYWLHFGVYWVKFGVMILLVTVRVALGWVAFLEDYVDCSFIGTVIYYVVWIWYLWHKRTIWLFVTLGILHSLEHVLLHAGIQSVVLPYLPKLHLQYSNYAKTRTRQATI